MTLRSIMELTAEVASSALLIISLVSIIIVFLLLTQSMP